jgi:hypothetical protein
MSAISSSNNLQSGYYPSLCETTCNCGPQHKEGFKYDETLYIRINKIINDTFIIYARQGRFSPRGVGHIYEYDEYYDYEWTYRLTDAALMKAFRFNETMPSNAKDLKSVHESLSISLKECSQDVNAIIIQYLSHPIQLLFDKIMGFQKACRALDSAKNQIKHRKDLEEMFKDSPQLEALCKNFNNLEDEICTKQNKLKEFDIILVSEKKPFTLLITYEKDL